MRYADTLVPILMMSIVILSSWSCNCHKKFAGQSSEISYLYQLADAKYGEDYKVTYNAPKDYAFVSKRFMEKEMELSNCAFFVFGIKDNNIIIEDTLSAGSLRWTDDYTLLFLERGQQSKSPTKAYTIDVKTGIRTVQP